MVLTKISAGKIWQPQAAASAGKKKPNPRPSHLNTPSLTLNQDEKQKELGRAEMK